MSFSTWLHPVEKLELPGKSQPFFRLLFNIESYFEVLSSWRSFAVSSRICIYDENNCLSEIRHFFSLKKTVFSLAGGKKKIKKMHVPENNPFALSFHGLFSFFLGFPLWFSFTSVLSSLPFGSWSSACCSPRRLQTAPWGLSSICWLTSRSQR